MVLDEEDYTLILMNRLNYWKPTRIEKKLFEDYYYRAACNGIFDNSDMTVMQIVDNDYVNWMKVISKGDEYYKEAKALYEKDGVGTCNDCFCIEAVDDRDKLKHYLVRWS